MTSISFRGVSKAFEDGTLAVDGLDLDIADGEFMVLVGPSGCGKTTSLRMVAGLEDPTAGEILIGDTVVNDVPSRSRDIAMVFQNYALYPHMNVADNLVFGLRMQGVSKTARRQRAREVADILSITELLDRRPKQLSGGQRQRVAMGRAIVREPQAFLMDEPLSNLDAKLRVQMRGEIARIQRRLGTTTLYVTHDQVEAMTMADRVAVMNHGLLQQLDTPADLYDHPTNLFVAGFIGSPPMNLFDGRIVEHQAGLAVQFGSHCLALGKRCPSSAAVGTEVVIGIRPEDIEDVAFDPGSPDDRRLNVDVELVEQLGSDIVVHALIDATPVRSTMLAVDATAPAPLDAGGLLVSRCNPRSRLARGQRANLSVDTDRIHLFDPNSGQTLIDSR